MVKIYFPAPNFSTATPPNDPLKQGHVLKSVKPSAFLAPLDPKGANTVVPINSEDLMPVDSKVGRRTSWKELLSGNFSIWALYNGCQQQAFRQAADLDRHIKHVDSKPPDDKAAPSREHAYLDGGHQQETSQRLADLDRHIKHVQSKPPDIYFCDYNRCPRSEKSVAALTTSTPKQPFGPAASLSSSSSAGTAPLGVFGRGDHLRARYRDYHREDLCRRDRCWWRCTECLRKVSYSRSGWECRDCEQMLELERINTRERILGTKDSSTSYVRRY